MYQCSSYLESTDEGTVCVCVEELTCELNETRMCNGSVKARI